MKTKIFLHIKRGIPFYLLLLCCIHSDLNAQTQIKFEFSEVVMPANDNRDLAVAFHSITFIDSLAKPLADLTFGTPPANSSQGIGWFQNEVSPVVGEFQWAGDQAKEATLVYTIPAGTEGFLLQIKSITDSLWMKVWLNGTLMATLRVDSYWHSGYVPIGISKMEPVSTNEPEWIPGHYFPHFPPPDHIYAIQANHGLGQGPLSVGGYSGAWQSDWRINNSYDAMMALTLVCMQGVINRNKPAVYLDWQDEPESAAFWIPYIENEVPVDYLDLDALSALNFLIRRFGNRFEGAVIYDPEVPNTINLATMIAGLENRLVLAPEQLTLPGLPNFNSITDLRQTVQSQGWNDSEASQYNIYQWVYDSLWPQLDHRIIGFISPGPPTSGTLSGAPGIEAWPVKMAARDFLVALKLPALHLNPFDAIQGPLMNKFMEEAPSPIQVTGVYGNYEFESVQYFSAFGDWVSGITWPGTPVDCRGLSVLSGIRPAIKKFDPGIDISRIFATLGNKPVAMLWSSDGDGIPFATERGYNPFWLWEDTQNQRFSWTFNPTAADLSPLLWNYFMDTRINTGMIAGLSGAGYAYPQEMSQAELNGYLSETATYLEETGMRVVRIDDRGGSGRWTEQLAVPYYQQLHNAGYLGSIYSISPSVNGLNLDYAGVAAPTVRPSHTMASNDRNEVIADLLSRVPGEYFMDITQYPRMTQNPFTEVVDDPDANNGKALLVLPESTGSQAYIFNSDEMSLAPGTYTVKFRLKVESNMSTQPITSIFVGKRFAFPDWQVLATKHISPSEFQEANTYQDFNFTFHLDTFTSLLQFRVDYGDGATRWYADDILVQREGGLDLPYFAGIFIVLTIDWGAEPDFNRTVEKFTYDFENQGGLVLTPDEFMAALNPEYMLALAKPILGSNDSSILAATAQLNSGLYFESLMTIRNALKGVVSSVIEPEIAISKDLYQLRAYPNPFRVSTTVQFELAESEQVELDVFNLLGQKLGTLIKSQLNAGKHAIPFDAGALGAGLYLIQLKVGSSCNVIEVFCKP
ncbi:MAG: T9SS type A sorting domain-containing protein [Lewinellaceae bacterium]|nr:T9SS type A sorting domain-containing protein [Saprospiraceae bacterium]MCB9343343.1 T9SS type A sorting domain-containing protein [Lewinellaceae bacterium]